MPRCTSFFCIINTKRHVPCFGRHRWPPDCATRWSGIDIVVEHLSTDGPFASSRTTKEGASPLSPTLIIHLRCNERNHIGSTSLYIFGSVVFDALLDNKAWLIFFHLFPMRQQFCSYRQQGPAHHADTKTLLLSVMIFGEAFFEISVRWFFFFFFWALRDPCKHLVFW